MNTTARAAIRTNLIAQRRSLEPIEQKQASLRVAEPAALLLESVVTGVGGVVAAYRSHRGEISPDGALALLMEAGWSVVLPVCGRDGQMDFCPWMPGDELVTNRYGIGEPETSPVALAAIDAVIVPGVAFDRRGNRIGHGVGFYDRFFDRCAQQSHQPYRLGVAYDFQIVELPAPEPWDIPVQSVVSPAEVIDTTPCE